MRILCGIDTQYTGKVTLSSDGNNYEDNDTIENDSDVDNAISEEIFGYSNPLTSSLFPSELRVTFPVYWVSIPHKILINVVLPAPFEPKY